MKKRIKYHRNPFLCLCAVLLCLTLFTTCLLCGILAKYRTTGGTDGSARAADFGQLTFTETTGSTYQVTPGVNITKDPIVSMSASEVAVSVCVDITLTDEWELTTAPVVGGSDTYTFSYMVDNNGNSSDGKEFAFMIWKVADGWTYSSSTVNTGANTTTYTFVWELAPGESFSNQHVITDDTITVSSEIYYDVYYDTVAKALDSITISVRAEQID